jgi:hypothetical protein
MKTAFHLGRVRWVVGFLLVSLLSPRSCAAAEGATRRGERFDIAEGRLSVILPDGWGKTDLNAADVKEVGKAKTGEVPGKTRKWPAIFATVEAVVKKGKETFAMRFYLFVFDTGKNLYLVQASTTQPVRESREAQIYEFLRSLVANS